MGRNGRPVRLLLAAVAFGSMLGATVAVVEGIRGGDRIEAVSAAPLPAAAPSVVEGGWPVPQARPSMVPSSFMVADALVPSVPLHDRPGGPAVDHLANPTWEGLAVVFSVLEHRGTWMRVRVSARPNGRQAWVRAVDVSMRRVPNWIKVELGAHRVTVFHRDQPLLSTRVAIGRAATPTPVGSFFVDGLVLLDPLDPAYGAGQVSVSGFSETLDSFGGGIGQIALHGTQATGLLGQATSNGCVRMANDAIRAVVALAPTGTPVEIVP